jgi:hypothetical protein
MKYVIRNKEGEDDYYLIQTDDECSLYHSRNRLWHEHIQGTHILTVTHTGDDYKWSRKVKLNDVCDAFYVSLLMRFLNRDEYLFFKEEAVVI